MPNPATLREQRLRKTKAQLIDEIDTLEQRAAALETANRSSAPMPAKASDRYLAKASRRSGWAARPARMNACALSMFANCRLVARSFVICSQLGIAALSFELVNSLGGILPLAYAEEDKECRKQITRPFATVWTVW